MKFKSLPKESLLSLAAIQAIVATFGSLYFSQILHLPPCTLCWYQRILMFPLAIILPIGVFRGSKELPYFVLPFTLLGMVVATYHNIIYYNIFPGLVAPCEVGVSCTTRTIEWFGFVTIPFLSFTAFIILTLLMLGYLILELKEKKVKPKKP